MNNAVKGWLVVLGIPLVVAGLPVLVGRYFMQKGWDWHQECINEHLSRATTDTEKAYALTTYCKEMPPL